MNKTKDQQAQKYAEKKLEEAFPEDWICEEDMRGNNFNGYDIKQAYSDGYTAAEQPMWRRVEEELPSNYHDVVASDENGLHISSYFNGEWYSCDDEFTRNPQMWMPIPPIPDTNTEKK